jgi:UDP-2,4-diacetamido-2,4,6-trideoxy-beta-L-altropyranose hydrolase
MNLLVRADAGAKMGTGHVMRCLALAQAWQDAGGTARFAMFGPPEGILARLKDEKIEAISLLTPPGSAEDAQQTVALARQCAAAWVVVDGYQFSGEYQRALKEAGLKLLAIDDYGHAGHYWADLVLNQNLHAEDGLYRSRAPYTQLLLGVRYALLRREFIRWQGWQRKIPDIAGKVLISVGGGDTHDATLCIIEALGRIDIPGLEAVVLAGAMNCDYAGLQAAAERCPAKVRLESSVRDMPSLMAWADVSLGAAGSTSWERAFMGLPSAVIVLAGNQESVARELAASGVANNLGPIGRLGSGKLADHLASLLRSPLERHRMAEAGQRMIDGDGSRRVHMRLVSQGLEPRA